jgi:hypothetical protein
MATNRSKRRLSEHRVHDDLRRSDHGGRRKRNSDCGYCLPNRLSIHGHLGNLRKLYPGFYHYQLEALRTSDNNRIVLETGFFTAVVDLDTNNADPRTHAEIMLAKIKSLLEGKADADVSNYSVAGRSLTKLSFDELIKARDYYQEEYNKEIQALRIQKKQATGTTVKVRFL